MGDEAAARPGYSLLNYHGRYTVLTVALPLLCEHLHTCTTSTRVDAVWRARCIGFIRRQNSLAALTQLNAPGILRTVLSLFGPRARKLVYTIFTFAALFQFGTHEGDTQSLTPPGRASRHLKSATVALI